MARPAVGPTNAGDNENCCQRPLIVSDDEHKLYRIQAYTWVGFALAKVGSPFVQQRLYEARLRPNKAWTSPGPALDQISNR